MRAGYWQDPETGKEYRTISGGTGLEEIIPILAAVGSIAGAGTGIASAVSAANRPQPKAPAMPAAIDPSQMARAILPQAKADAAARAGGGLSPDFLANLIGQQTGTPGAGMDILGEIKNSLGQGT